MKPLLQSKIHSTSIKNTTKFSSKINNNPTQRRTHSSSIESGLEELIEEIEQHRALRHEYFQYLRNQTSIGLKPIQFDIHRANYFWRTSQTISSVARVVTAAAENNDYQTLTTAGKNLFEETGEGNAWKAHSLLLEHSHNTHAQLFGLSSLRLRDAAQSPLLVKRTHEFVEYQKRLYTHKSYPIVLAANFAQEFAAHSMLNDFYEALFLPYKNHYKESKFQEISEYFLTHLGGVEKEHADDAKAAMLRACKRSSDIILLRTGAISFLDIQANLWDGMLVAVEKAARSEQTIVPKGFKMAQSHLSSDYRPSGVSIILRKDSSLVLSPSSYSMGK